MNSTFSTLTTIFILQASCLASNDPGYCSEPLPAAKPSELTHKRIFTKFKKSSKRVPYRPKGKSQPQSTRSSYVHQSFIPGASFSSFAGGMLLLYHGLTRENHKTTGAGAALISTSFLALLYLNIQLYLNLHTLMTRLQQYADSEDFQQQSSPAPGSRHKKQLTRRKNTFGTYAHRSGKTDQPHTTRSSSQLPQRKKPKLSIDTQAKRSIELLPREEEEEQKKRVEATKGENSPAINSPPSPYGALTSPVDWSLFDYVEVEKPEAISLSDRSPTL
jgi:hypothetical protein